MGKAAKKLEKIALIAPDIEFATIIHDETAEIIAEQGVVMLYSAESGNMYQIPAGLPVTAQDYGVSYTVTVRDLTKEVILKPGPDDLYESQLDDPGNENVMPVDDLRDLYGIIDDLKIKKVTKVIKSLGSMVAGVALGVVSWVLIKKGFKFSIAAYAGVGIGVLITLFSCFFKFIPNIRRVSARVVGDSLGNYINLETGVTNMNGGMRIPIK